MLPSVFHKFSNQDMINWLNENGIGTVEENSWRIVLKSGKSRDLLDLLIKKSNENQVEIFNWIEIQKIERLNLVETTHGASNMKISSSEYSEDPLSTKRESWLWKFKITTNKWIFETRNLIIATGWKSFPQVWATGFGYEIAKKFGIKVIQPYRWLCGIETVEDIKELAWNTIEVNAQIIDWKKVIYEEFWSVLFTHRWISGPVIFNSAIAIWNKSGSKIKLNFDIEKVSKKIIRFWNLNEKNNEVILNVKSIRPREEAKVTWWGVNLDEIKNNFEVKKIPWLYFVGEILDITGRTGGYNLQWARSSGYVCGSMITDDK